MENIKSVIQHSSMVPLCMVNSQSETTMSWISYLRNSHSFVYVTSNVNSLVKNSSIWNYELKPTWSLDFHDKGKLIDALEAVGLNLVRKELRSKIYLYMDLERLENVFTAFTV